MTADELRKKYLEFFVSKGHKIIPSASLVPENDPTVLFTTAGMHPLIPYLLGQPHPQGKKLANFQKCLRTDDIDEVGDKTHHTFFEMLGNWSLGDYFKKEAIEYSFEFLTSKDWLGIDKEKLAISVFAGDQDAPFDEESYNIWVSLGISEQKITKLAKKDNWWGPAGKTGPCGPDTEMFIWAGKNQVPQNFDPNDPNWVEVWNDVFMQYNKTKEGKFEPISQKNVDTGMGLERALSVINNLGDDYLTNVFKPAIEKLETITNAKYSDRHKEFRIITDHLKASVFIIADEVEPSNKQQGYVLRRLIRRAALQLKKLGVQTLEDATKQIAGVFIEIMSQTYSELKINQTKIIQIIEVEIKKFNQTLDKGLKEFEKLATISGKDAFNLFQTYGFPLELTEELAEEKGLKINRGEFEEEFKKHQELSRTASSGMFKGGLSDSSEIVTKYHTATHLLNAALRQILGSHVEQKGSNITAERLRFDFSHPEKLSPEETQQVEDLVNQKIKEDLPVTSEIMDKDQALKSGAIGVFGEKYGEKVTIYTVSPSTGSGSAFSREICGGPHVKSTGELGTFKITKEESSSAGIRRIYATLS
ncbi:alanine--tRNA ligase [Candidatus Daviesbacteria bacterium]|nr:alanine--tRNA ligase [Candidatus Daviesbacteria bacterium]